MRSNGGYAFLHVSFGCVGFSGILYFRERKEGRSGFYGWESKRRESKVASVVPRRLDLRIPRNQPFALFFSSREMPSTFLSSSIFSPRRYDQFLPLPFSRSALFSFRPLRRCCSNRSRSRFDPFPRSSSASIPFSSSHPRYPLRPPACRIIHDH